MSDGIGWTEERIEQVKTLWAEGLSASQIARVLGNVSRNSVIGKVHRLGLAGRLERAHYERTRSPVVQKKAVATAEQPEEPVVEQDPIILANGRYATTMTINDRMCRWPIGDPAENGFHYCGHKPTTGSPYCMAHKQKAYQPAPQRRRRVA